MRRVAQSRKKRALLGNIHGYVRMYAYVRKDGKRTCVCTHMYVCACARVRAVGRVNGTRTHINAEAGKRVRARVESNVRTSPLDFVDGISTWIDYLAIDVCRKHGEYACRGACRSGLRFLSYRTAGGYIYIINGWIVNGEEKKFEKLNAPPRGGMCSVVQAKRRISIIYYDPFS